MGKKKKNKKKEKEKEEDKKNGKKIKTEENEKKKEKTAQRFTVDLHSKIQSSFSFFLISWYCIFFFHSLVPY